ncbi:MAG TPA: YbjP/YqhG family protein [Scandinavium sp.]|jgi:hypothetical protein|uniref:YbjP/YqhG family protein n=1 Tax=Scandinavium sp. TaxID=2830653 RepID=UPI002E322F20|nr:YbjP/YqhG family protein [Scandinavium sp.]HEX4503916.1 YbjP/YqhG family protein [Scandinavium sp.]
MKWTLSILITLILTACQNTASNQSSEAVSRFYQDYMHLYLQEDISDLIDYTNPVFNQYVSSDLTARLKTINEYYEQEIIDSDYFMYVQDYSVDWIPAFRLGSTKPFLGGEVVEIWLGVEDKKQIHLLVYTRQEKGQWKIYRVKDLTDHFEHAVYDAGSLSAAKAWSAKIEPEYKAEVRK